MNFVDFFASPSLENVSQSIIAKLLYDIANEDAPSGNTDSVETIESIFFESITEGAKNILKSEQTKKRILESLQDKTLENAFREFADGGSALTQDYFIDRFSRVISKKNAKKITPLFLDHFRQKIAGDETLSRQLLNDYKDLLTNADWELDDDEQSELKYILNSMNGDHDAEEENGASDYDGELAVIYFKNNQSGQLVYWHQSEYVLPVRGLRKIETWMKESPFLCITGAPGCGKSALVSAFVHHRVANEDVARDNVYYYRFMETEADYDTFTDSLKAFLKERGIEIEDDNNAELPYALVESDATFILDDFHHVLDKQLLEMLQKFWTSISETEIFRGQFIVSSRKKPEMLPLSNITHFEYKGLSVAESSALIRDKWRLGMPKKSARALAKKIHGNPLLMLLFRNWWITERHTDTELERFIDYMPKDVDRLRTYISDHLYDLFERYDMRLNSVLKAVSIFSRAEDEDFFELSYEKIGGSEFQGLLEPLVETYQIISPDDDFRTYKMHDTLRHYYYQKLDTIQIIRILHNNAGHLYRHRFEQEAKMMDALEGARHFQRAEREEEAVKLLEVVMDKSFENEVYVLKILNILKDINFDLIDQAQSKVNVLFNRGKFYFQTGLVKEAEADFLASQELAPPANLKGHISYYLGRVSRQKGRPDQGFHLFEEALEKFEAVNDKLGVAMTYSELGEIYLERGELQPAFELFERALSIYASKDHQEGSLKTHNHLGWIFKTRQEWQSAYHQYEKALEICEKLHNQTGIADALRNLGQIKDATNDLNAAIGLFYKEMRLREKISDWLGAGLSYEQIGIIYEKQSAWENAMEFYGEAQEIFERIEDLPGIASVSKNIGIVYQGRQEWESAMAYHQKSQELYERLENMPELAESFIRIALVYREMEEWERALDMYDKALEIKERLGDSPGIAGVYERIGDIYQDQNQFQYAMEVYERSIMMREELNDPAGISQIYFKIADIFHIQKDLQSATGYYQRALDIFEKIEDIPGMAKSFRSLGRICQSLKDWQPAMEYYRQSFQGYQHLNDPEGLGHIWYQMGNIYHDIGDWMQALQHYKKSLPFFEETSDFFHYSQSLGNISSIEFEQKDHTLAIGKQVEILLYFQNLDEKELVERVLSNLVACHEELGPDTFQALLSNCLEKISRVGVNWGRHNMITAQRANEMIAQIFYNAQK